MQRSRAAALLLTILPAQLALGCGGDKSAAPVEPAPVAAPAAQPVPVAPAAVQVAPAQPATPDAEGVVRITGNDTMRFSANRIEVKAGKVKLELKNAGTLPKIAMGHNLIVLKPGNDVNAFAARAAGAQATDYVPADAQDLIVAHTRLLGPGESQVIEFDAPAPGVYPFLCSFPGHVAIMNGQLVVQ